TVTWNDGRTIAFRPEINAVLARLAPAGLPPFGAVLLLLAATRDNWDAVEDPAGAILAGYEHRGVLMTAVTKSRVRYDVGGIVDDLRTVANLPADLKQKPAARTSLAEFVFSVAKPAVDARAAEQIIRLLETGIDPGSLSDRLGRDGDYSHLSEELDSLRPGLARVAKERVSAWLRTGVDRDV